MTFADAIAARENPTVSVVMTTYNGARFVEASVGSLLMQTHRSIELVIVDDGSQDETPRIVRDLAASDPRITFVVTPHSGIASSRNQALALATAPYVTFLDQDDLCPPDRIARQYARLASEPGVAALFGSTVMFESLHDNGQVAAADLARAKLTMLISAALFRRDAVTAVGPFDQGYQIADDFDFLLRLVECGRCIEVESLPAVFYRRHPGQHSADESATRSECIRALSRSLHRRRAKGITGQLQHPLLRTDIIVQGNEVNLPSR